MRLLGLVTALGFLGVAACGDSAQEASSGLTGADSVAMAEVAFSSAVFDTISWDSPAAALERGDVVFTFSCLKCHGPAGMGDGGFVTRGDTLRPPSFVAESWTFAGDLEGLRHRIFTGTPDGMPHWGLEGLREKDVDAVARFILEQLRGEEPGG